MSEALVECIHASCGTQMRPGDRLLDLSVDLSRGFSQGCPPISFYRVVLRETLWLRRLMAKPGTACGPDEAMAIFTTEPDESVDGAAARPVRIATAGIIYHAGMWSGGTH